MNRFFPYFQAFGIIVQSQRFLIMRSVPHLLGQGRAWLFACIAFIPNSLHSSAATNSEDLALLQSWLPAERSALSLLFRYDSAAANGPEVSATDLHKAIDRAGPTVTLLRVRAPYHDAPRIVGGYNPKSWKSWTGRYESSPGRFIFDLDREVKWERVDRRSRSIRLSPEEYGLSFGEGDLVLNSDLTTGSARNTTFAPPSNSSVLMGQAGPFFVESIEVYQVLRTPKEIPPEPARSWISESPGQYREPTYAVPDPSSPILELWVLLGVVVLGYALRPRL